MWSQPPPERALVGIDVNLAPIPRLDVPEDQRVDVGAFDRRELLVHRNSGGACWAAARPFGN